MMNDSRDAVMADQVRAERIKKILLKNGTYEEMAERTKIGSRTLLRIATGKTEPKFSDIIEIA
ncbi:helix-turn-helix domain-containing protein, partial [Vibrio cyclitrophicus]